MSILFRQLTLVVLATHLLTSCGGSSDDDTNVVTLQSGGSAFDGSRPAISDVYSQSQLDALEQIGLVFNLGSQPPDIEGTYRFNNRVLQATSVPGDTANEFVSTTITFSNQNNATLTVEYTSVEDEGVNTGTTTGTGSFISGSGQAFTVYVVSETIINGSVADSTATISGVISSSGIENIQLAGFMLDNRGDTLTFIPNDTGRLIIDADGLSQRLSVNAPLAAAKVSNNTRGGFSR